MCSSDLAYAGHQFGHFVPQLGAGKTAFVRGVARGLGSTDRVHSPTFALLNEYRTGRLPLYHLDLYRLDSTEAILGAGLEPYLENPDGVSVVEWFDRWQIPSPRGAVPPHPDNLLLVRFEAASPDVRRIVYDDPRP